MANSPDKGCLRVSSFNCRSVKNSLLEVNELCNISDFVFIQEHWLLPCDMPILNNIHTDFIGTGRSAVDLSEDVLRGRPYGGTAILYNKMLSPYIKVVETFDPRLTAVKFNSCVGPVLLVCVYMPTDVGDHDCLECYIDACSRISALYSDPDIVHAIIGGDFNCQVGTRFYNVFASCAAENRFQLSDVKRLVNASTFCSDDGTRSSWIDHFLCSHSVDDLILTVQVLDQFITSDHKHLMMQFSNVYGYLTPCQEKNATVGSLFCP